MDGDYEWNCSYCTDPIEQLLDVVKPDMDSLVNDQSPCLASISSLSLRATDIFLEFDSARLQGILSKFEGLQVLQLQCVIIDEIIDEKNLQNLCPNIWELYLYDMHVSGQSIFGFVADKIGYALCGTYIAR